MEITKTLQVKVVSIGPGKLRPTNAEVQAARRAVGNGKTTTVPIMPVGKDCIQVSLAVVDASGRYMNRATLSFAEGKMTTDTTDLGAASDGLNAALTTVFSELDKTISGLIAAGKLSL